MSQNTNIEWTNATWNPVRGCSRISPGCVNCYAERIAARFSGGDMIDTPKSWASNPAFNGFAIQTDSGPRWTGKVELIESKLLEPLHWRKPRRVFVNSMSDLFHENLPDESIDRVFAVMALTPHITYQVLTKRAGRMREYFAPGIQPMRIAAWAKEIHQTVVPFKLPSETIFDARRVAQNLLWEIVKWPLPNVWLGVSVENQTTADERIPELLGTPAALRFVSYEPALAEVDFYRWLSLASSCDDGIEFRLGDRCPDCGEVQLDPRPTLDWGIIGGESGPGARPFDLNWVRNTIRQFKSAGVPLFVKQLGAVPISDECERKCGYPDRLLLKDNKGGNWDEWPADLRVREFPTVGAHFVK